MVTLASSGAEAVDSGAGSKALRDGTKYSADSTIRPRAVPTAIRTRSLPVMRMARCPCRAAASGSVGVEVSVPRSYNSAEASSPRPSVPPTNRTFPSASAVAVKLARATDMCPAGSTRFWAGSKMSMKSSAYLPSKPPAMTTLPSSRTASA
jgi:hypothetical protein